MEYQRHHSCFRDLFMGIIMVDRNLNILFANRWVTGRLPVDKRNATHLFELYDNFQRTGVQEMIHKVITTKNPRIWSHAFHSWIIPLQDTRFSDGLMKQSAVVTPLEGHAVIQIRDESESVLRVEMVRNFYDDMLRKEEQLQSTKRMQALGTLAGGLAHHFNNMLAVIAGNSELILEDLTPPAVKDYTAVRSMLDEILHTCMYGKEMVHQVLTFARQRFREKQVIPIVETIMEAVERIHAALPDNITLKFSMQTLHKTFMGDGLEIQQIFHILAANAVDALALTGGEIHIVVSEPGMDDYQRPVGTPKGPCLSLVISDTGPGIPTEIRARIFEPFFTTRKGRQGMGLAVANGIVAGYEGIIHLTSQLGQGTRVEVLLPMALPPSLSPAENQ